MQAYVALKEHSKVATVSYNVDCLPPDASKVLHVSIPAYPASLRMSREASLAFSLIAYGYEVDYESWELA